MQPTPTRDDFKRQHLETCRADRDARYAELESYRASARTGRDKVDTTQKTIANLEAEIAQLTQVIEQYEGELGNA